jgi:hypothetical protein
MWGVIAFVCVAIVVLLIVENTAPAGTIGAAPQGTICRTTDDLLAAAESAPDAEWDVPSVLTEQLPAEFGPGLILPGDRPIPQASTLAEGRSDPGEWVDELTTNGFEDGLERWWSGSYTVAGAQVLRFGSHAGALGFQHWIIHASCMNASRVFAVAGISGTIGLQINWSDGDVSEQVSFVRGPYRYLVSVRTGQAPLPWWVVDETRRLAIALGIPLTTQDTPCSDVRGKLPSVDRRTLEHVEGADADDPVALLPMDPGSPMEAVVTGRPTTTPKSDPALGGIHDDFQGVWRTRLASGGFRDRAQRDWTLTDGSGTVAIDVFETHRDAIEYQDWLTADVMCYLATETFVPAVTAGIGLRMPWGAGMIGHYVSFVRGRIHVDVLSVTDGSSTDRVRIDGLARTAEDAVS